MAVAYFARKHVKRNRWFRQKHKTSSVTFENGLICRICLNTGNIPIYGMNSNNSIAISIEIFGDIHVKATDDFPKHLCQDCYDLLQNAVRFRKSAKYSDQLLHQIQSRGEVPKFCDILPKNDQKYVEDTSKSFNCKVCEINFTTRGEYTIHNNSKKHKKLRIQCHICRRLLTAKLYKRHLAHHESSASHLICEVCGKLFRKDNLVRHLQLHNFELPYHCQICPYRGRYGESLKTHMRTHTGDKPFNCNKCELRFLTRSNLNRHLSCHKKERPIKCHECGRGFYTKRDLQIHFDSGHVGIKEFECQICDNKYGTKKGLMRHELRAHKREKMGRGRMPLYLQPEYQAFNTKEPNEKNTKFADTLI